MLLTTCTVLTLSAGLIHAFTNTSPLFMFSTSELLSSSPQIVSADSISKTISLQLSKCPSDTYVVITQPGVHAEDYRDPYAAPYLRKKINGEDDRIRSSLSVTDVLGDVDTDMIVQSIESTCGAALLKIDASTGSFAVADDPNPRVIHLDFPALPTNGERGSKLRENDAFLSSLLDLLPTSKFTVIYTTTPSSMPHTSTSSDHVEPEIYEMDTLFSSQTHMELKRDYTAHGKRDDSNGNVTLPNAPLFEKYAYLSPGIFMALLVALPLFLILYVGVTGVASLQVSYAAFDKEMGPAAQRKQQ